jgi:putative ABC transport system permease protein
LYWKIVGVFDANGSMFESEIWGDVEVIGPTDNRGGYHSVTLRMRDPSTIDALNSELTRTSVYFSSSEIRPSAD